MGVTATVPIYLELRLAGIHAPPGRAATGGRRHGKGIKEPTGARIPSPRAPRRERAAQVAPDRRLAEDRGGASAHAGGGMMVSCGLVGDYDRRRELDHVTQLDRGRRSVGL